MPIRLSPIPDLQKQPRARNSRAARNAIVDAMPSAQVVLGIDPGLSRTGFAVLKRGQGRAIPQVLESGFLAPPRQDELGPRLKVLFDELGMIIARHEPQVMVVEDVFSTFAHPRSALLMAHGRGVLLLAAQQQQIPVCHFLPNEIKQVITGNGHASKEMMQSAVQKRLCLEQTPSPHDVADAIAIAFCFLLRQRL
jgi:crossover junction endodeoxyribonuclease RuvC